MYSRLRESHFFFWDTVYKGGSARLPGGETVCVKPFRHNTGVWRTDRQADTDGTTSCDSIVHAMHTRRAVKSGQNFSIGISRILLTEPRRRFMRSYGTVCLSFCLSVCEQDYYRYSASKNGVTLKPGVGVFQGRWKWRRSTDHILLDLEIWVIGHWSHPFESLDAVSYLQSIVSMTVSLTVYEIFSVKV